MENGRLSKYPKLPGRIIYDKISKAAPSYSELIRSFSTGELSLQVTRWAKRKNHGFWTMTIEQMMDWLNTEVQELQMAVTRSVGVNVSEYENTPLLDGHDAYHPKINICEETGDIIILLALLFQKLKIPLACIDEFWADKNRRKGRAPFPKKRPKRSQS